MQAVILAGGLGTRLRPLTYTIPKPMLPVANKPALLHTVESLAAAHFSEVIVTTNFLAECISDGLRDLDLPIPVHCVKEDVPLGTAGCVKNIIDRLDDTFLVIQGDAVSDLDFAALVQFSQQKNADVTLSVMPVKDTREFGIVQIDDEGRIERFQEKPRPDEAFSCLANSGYYLVKKKVFDDVPLGEVYDFGLHLFPHLMETGARFYAHSQDAYWIDIGRINNYLEANCNRIKGRAQIAVGVRVPDSCTLVPPFLIGEDVRLGENCVLGPHVIVGSRSKIGADAQLSGSVIFRDVTIGSGARLNDCVVASGSNLGTNVSVEPMVIIGEGCNLGDNVHVRAHSKLGPVISILEGQVVDGVISPQLEKIDILQNTIASAPGFGDLGAEQLRICALLAECGELTARSIAATVHIPYSRIHAVLYPLEVAHLLLSTLDVPKRYALAHEFPHYNEPSGVSTL